MAPFFGKLRGNAGAGTPASPTTPVKKDILPLPMTPLEKMLQDAGPLRNDGSDKFFGMENAQYGNTCYCNSILQCLYYSVPFRESVINYPRRSPIESLNECLAKNLRYPDPNAPMEDKQEAKQKAAANSSAKGGATPPAQQPPKPEDKDSPEYKKKVAMHRLPILETTDNATSYGMQESLFTSLKDIFEAIVASQERMGVIRPYTFLEVLRREHEMFRTAMHQDAHEFLNLLLNEVVANVEAEAKRSPPPELDQQSENGEMSVNTTTTGSVATTLATSNTSKSPNTTRWVHELFEGTLTSETQCLTCENISQRDEVFLDLSVDLDQHSSVTSCLRKFSEEEMLCERNKFHCDNCGGLQEAEKRMKIKRLPRILALHLKRFKYTEDLQRLQKLFHRVVYPYYLRLFNTTDDAEDPDRLYELYAVVVHIGGGPYHGHYVAIIKTEDRGWLLFDDEMVEPVDKNYVRNFFGDRPGLACAYVLFYQETTFEAMQKEQEKEGMTPENRASVDTKDLVSASQSRMNGSATGSDEINRVHTVIPATDSAVTSPLKKIPTAPQPSAQPENSTSGFAPLPHPPQIPVTPPSAPLNSKKSDAAFKKERAKEERERKAAEKEKEKAQKQKRKELEARLKEEIKRQDADLKAALELSKASKTEEDRRIAAARNGKENGQSGGLGGGLGRFKLGSRSLSQGRLYYREKEKGAKSSTDTPPVPALPTSPALPSPDLGPRSLAAESSLDNNWPLKEEVSSPVPTDSTTRNKDDGSATPKIRPNTSSFFNNMKIRQREVPNNSNRTSDHTNTNNINDHSHSHHAHTHSYDHAQSQNQNPTYNGTGSVNKNNGKPLQYATSKRSRFSLRKKSFSVI
ncbi:ubiquitin thiolesterase [Blastomyces gilchristii SLH14081]|uniref:ubiquitinyl hydrolase 1 n=1 Tax=Blastomyces gilchristii (strain SLH14081) TaxID=559298 RepID=A0A179UF77_BLAGS|nr:ubiquitin thiolesterase [Blastomyces gilchristii SLH14081]OAT05938.1 ubiquitin thiolesterase [Blastomyces gilchristii SLH14081]